MNFFASEHYSGVRQAADKKLIAQDLGTGGQSAEELCKGLPVPAFAPESVPQ